ncbi:S-layer homology domain-containing protein [Niallia endozanthoxylica]|uniref:S-layer homology domain-containing protein n=1 Tax=Niallia endozanthoxylica TaxID=2036016 RepID=A0A5J5H794_9BACI|nr:S-layer homology domain-containing protein [Niallia endozanthoxylica]KAA9015503.1 S-layer homology domain-containing protein [Niallia endozanthoxylica]
MSSSTKYRKFLAATVGTTIAASSALTVVPYNVLNVKAASFTDIEPGTYFYDAVIDLSGKGIIKGFDDGTFKPYQLINRGQASAMIARALKLDVTNVSDPGFTDVSKHSTFYSSIAALVDAGIVDGVTADTFEPNRTITRAEMAKMVVNAFGLKQNKDTSLAFTDVPSVSWYTEFVKALYDNGVTVGVTETTFAPHNEIKRGQLATFIYRAQKIKSQSDVIENVTDSSVVIDGQSYKMDENLQKLFNAENAAVLKNALIQFEQKDGVIISVKSLEITESGKSGQNGQLVLDGKNAVIDGDVTINGDYVTVKNITVKGNFTIGSAVKNSFSSDKLTVEGKTVVSNESVSSASMTAAAEKKAKLVFSNSTLKVIELNQEHAALELKGSTTVLEIKVSANASISADSTVVIPKITLQSGAKQVEIDANVKQLIVNSATTKITLKEGSKIENLVLPEGLRASDIIENYDEVKQDIDEINGEDNPDAGTSPGGGGGGGGGGDTTPPTFDNSPTAETGTLKGEINVAVDLNEAGKVYYVVVAKGATAPSVANVKAGKDHTGTEDAIKAGSFNVTRQAHTEIITGLTGGSQYDVYVVAQDSRLNTQRNVTKVSNSVTAAGAELGQAGTSNTLQVVNVTGSGNITVGPETGTLVLTQGLEISGPFEGTITLRNIELQGAASNLTVDTEKATVVLEETVTVDGQTIIEDVSDATFSSSATHTGSIAVSDSNGTKLELNGAASNANVEITGTGTVALAGQFNQPIAITGSPSLAINPGAVVSSLAINAGASVPSLAISPGAAVSSLTINPGAAISSLAISPGAAITTLEINEDLPGLVISGAVYEIKPAPGITLAGQLQQVQNQITSTLDTINDKDATIEQQIDALVAGLKLDRPFVEGIIGTVISNRPADGYPSLLDIKPVIDVAIAKRDFTLENTSAVINNLTLPSSYKNGVRITWESSDVSVIGHDGKVTRPEAGDGDATVTLTATFSDSDGTVADTKEFTVTVKEKTATGTIAVPDRAAVGSNVEITVSDKDYINEQTEETINVTVGAEEVALKEIADSGEFVGTYEASAPGQLTITYQDLMDADGKSSTITKVIQIVGLNEDITAPVLQSAIYTLNGETIDLTKNGYVIELSPQDIKNLANLSFIIKDDSDVTISAKDSILGYDLAAGVTLSPENGFITYDVNVEQVKALAGGLDLLNQLANGGSSITLDVNHVRTLIEYVESEVLPGTGDTITLDAEEVKAVIGSEDLWNNLAGDNGQITLDVATVRTLFGNPALWDLLADQTGMVALSEESINALFPGIGSLSGSLNVSFIKGELAKESFWNNLSGGDGQITFSSSSASALVSDIGDNIDVGGSITVDRVQAIKAFEKIFDILDNNVDGSITLNKDTAKAFLATLNLPEGFPYGETQITLTMEDAEGNAAEPITVTVKLKRNN